MSDVRGRQNGRPARKSWRSLFCFLCVAISLVLISLLLFVVLVLLKVPLGLEHATVGGFTVVLYKHAILPVIIFFADLLRSLFPWPFMALIVMGLCLWKTDLLTELFSSIGAFELRAKAMDHVLVGDVPCVKSRKISEFLSAGGPIIDIYRAENSSDRTDATPRHRAAD
jgi:hypothetical protein